MKVRIEKSLGPRMAVEVCEAFLEDRLLPLLPEAAPAAALVGFAVFDRRGVLDKSSLRLLKHADLWGACLGRMIKGLEASVHGFGDMAAPPGLIDDEETDGIYLRVAFRQETFTFTELVRDEDGIRLLNLSGAFGRMARTHLRVGVPAKPKIVLGPDQFSL